MSAPCYVGIRVAYEPLDGEDDELDDQGFPAWYFNFDWMTPHQYLALARDLVAALDAGHDGRAVLQAWRRMVLDDMGYRRP
jgi:hypothetical protein